MAVTSLPVPLAIKGSARNRQDVKLTGRSPIRVGHVRNRPIPITGQSIGASIIKMTMKGCVILGLVFIFITTAL